jgi:hypothetical protein
VLDFSVFGCDVCQNVGYASELERPKLSWYCKDGQRVTLDFVRQGTAKTLTVVLETPEETLYLILTPFILEKICRRIEGRVLA